MGLELISVFGSGGRSGCRCVLRCELSDCLRSLDPLQRLLVVLVGKGHFSSTPRGGGLRVLQ